MNLFDLTGKTALITGASQGLGKRFVAHTLAEAGAKVIIAACKLDHLIRIAETIQAKGRTNHPPSLRRRPQGFGWRPPLFGIQRSVMLYDRRLHDH